MGESKELEESRDRVLTLITKINPRAFKMDGKIHYNYEAVSGEFIVGRGDTAWEAMKDFAKNFYGE